MATKKIVPRANGEGAIGDNTAGAEKYWGGGFFNNINGTNAIEMASFNDSLQWKASTTYAKGSIVFTSGLSAGMYLECLIDGTSNTDKFAIPSSIVPNTTTITDNTVKWIVREICSTQIDDSYSRKPNTKYLRGEIRFLYGELPVGWFLECSAAGISGSGDLTITTPTEGDTVTDGTVTWVMKKMGTGGGGDGVPLGAILAYSANGTLPDGYLLCDGSAVSRTMFPDLFAAIGTTYGAGDGSTTFNVPDYNTAERFCQGSTVAGTVKSAGLPNIEGTLKSVSGLNIAPLGPTAVTQGAVIATNLDTSGYILANSSSSYAQYGLSIDASQSNPIYGASNTVQPPALTTRYIIKAFSGQTASSALIDITQYAADLANKASRDLDNLSAAGEAKIQTLSPRYLTDSYYDDSTGDWYRVYSDGWVEQGGRVSYSNNTTLTVTLLKPMADARYSITRCNGASSSSAGYSGIVAEYYMSVYNLTTTSFRAETASNTSWNCSNYSWTVSGQGASV